jgi:phenylacetate-CoA ligase
MPEKKYWNEKIETLPRAELEALQLSRLREHLAFAESESPWYKSSFAEAGVKASELRGLSDLRAFPFINKKIERDRQIAKPLLGDMAAVGEREVVFVSASSGTTGVPTLSPFTASDFETFQDNEARLFWSAGMRDTDRYVHALNFTLFVGGPDVIGAQRLGALCFWAGTIPSDRLLYIMKEFGATITWTTPSYAWHLGETARASGIDPARDLKIRKIIVAGEPGGSIPATRAAIESIWNAELYDFYGISDIYGACAGMCSERSGLHLVEDDILLEVLDPSTGEPVPDGEKGEMVLTTLTKRARPMIRFRTGDIIVADHSKCACGRTHVRFTVTGRLDDMFIVSGVNVFPSDIEYVVRSVPGLSGEYRITVYEEEHLTRYDLDVEYDPSAAKAGAADGAASDGAPLSAQALADRIAHDVKTRLGVKPKKVNVVEPGTLPRSTHKAKRLVDLRKKA